MMDSLARPGFTAGRVVLLCLVVLATLTLPGCAAIAGIFKAGVWVGVVIAVLVVGGAIALFSMLR
jgi:hypothetical protein